MAALGIDGGVINKFHQLYKGDEHYLKALKSLEYDILYGDMYVYNGQSPYVATDMKMGTYEIKIKDIIKDEGQFDKTDQPLIGEGVISNPNIIKDMTNNTGNDKDKADNIEKETTGAVDKKPATSKAEENGKNENNESGEETTDNPDDNNSQVHDEEFYKDSYIVVGENFTEYSVVYVNGEIYETEYIDENHLRVHIEALNSLDTFVVKQYYLGKTLSRTSDFIYIKVDTPEPETTEETN